MKEVRGLDVSIKQAVEGKRIDAPLTPQRAGEFVRYVSQLTP